MRYCSLGGARVGDCTLLDALQPAAAAAAAAAKIAGTDMKRFVIRSAI
jgi:hypothetical protein